MLLSFTVISVHMCTHTHTYIRSQYTFVTSVPSRWLSRDRRQLGDWKRNTDYTSYLSTDQVIIWFWKAVENYDNEWEPGCFSLWLGHPECQWMDLLSYRDSKAKDWGNFEKEIWRTKLTTKITHLVSWIQGCWWGGTLAVTIHPQAEMFDLCTIYSLSLSLSLSLPPSLPQFQSHWSFSLPKLYTTNWRRCSVYSSGEHRGIWRSRLRYKPPFSFLMWHYFLRLCGLIFPFL